MKTMMKTNKRLMISAISVVIMAVLVVCFCSPNANVAFAQSQNKGDRIVKEMNAFSDNAKNQRLYNLTLNHMVVNMDATASISATKQLIDFDGNTYTLFEMSPIGYAIYHIASGKYVEYAENSYSPYLGYHSNLYYGGGMQYYWLQNDTFLHTLKADLSIPACSITEMAMDSSKMSNAFCNNVSFENLNYVNDGVNLGDIAAIRGIVAQKENIATRATTARIGMTTFFPALNTSTKMGYRGGGVCGYIATNLILGYNFFAFDYGLISNSSFVDFNNKTMNGPGLTNRLLVLAGEDPSGTNFSGTYSHDMFVIVREYFDEIYNTESWRCSWYFLNTNVKSTLDDGHPVAIFGSLKQPNGASGKINHAVVAYDYANYGFLNARRKYRVHYGWSGYASVWLESPTIGSNFFMKLA